jgi:hypothetical protein
LRESRAGVQAGFSACVVGELFAAARIPEGGRASGGGGVRRGGDENGGRASGVGGCLRRR